MRAALSMIMLWAFILPASAQLVKPQLTEPPCPTAHNCPDYKRGAALEPPGPSQRQKITCPSGTVYNPEHGTCKVVSSR